MTAERMLKVAEAQILIWEEVIEDAPCEEDLRVALMAKRRWVLLAEMLRAPAGTDHGNGNRRLGN